MANLATVQHPSIRLTFVDNASTLQPTDVYIDPMSTGFPQFLAIAHDITAQYASVIMSQYTLARGNSSATSESAEPGFAPLDGNWYYRFIIPFDYTTQIRNTSTGDWETIRRTGQDKREWAVLDCQDAFTHMINRFMRGNTSLGRWIEIMHKCQLDRDARMQAYNAFNQLLSKHPTGKATTRQPPAVQPGVTQVAIQNGENLVSGSVRGEEQGSPVEEPENNSMVITSREDSGRKRSATM